MDEIHNARRNSEFHELFRTIPSTERLIDSFSCALKKEILLHGRMYFSDLHVCFSSNILGWATNLVIAFSEVVAIEKKMTAFVIPNAIQVSTLHSSYFFTSFMWRDDAYLRLVAFWRNNLIEKPVSTTALLECVRQENSAASTRPLDHSANHDDVVYDDLSAQATVTSLHRSVAAKISKEDMQSTVVVDQLSCDCQQHYPVQIMQAIIARPLTRIGVKACGSHAAYFFGRRRTIAYATEVLLDDSNRLITETKFCVDNVELSTEAIARACCLAIDPDNTEVAVRYVLLEPSGMGVVCREWRAVLTEFFQEHFGAGQGRPATKSGRVSFNFKHFFWHGVFFLSLVLFICWRWTGSEAVAKNEKVYRERLAAIKSIVRRCELRMEDLRDEIANR